MIRKAALVTCAACVAACTPIPDPCDGPGACAAPADAGGAAAAVAPAGCDPSARLADSPACIASSFAIFVSPHGDDTAEGTQEAPVKTVAHGVLKAAAAEPRRPRVYVCEGTYADNVLIASPIAVYGGLACDWKVTGARPRLAPPSGVVITVKAVKDPVLLTGLDVAASADPAKPGDSAIGLFVASSSALTLDDVVIESGIGTAGATGSKRQNYTSAQAPGGQTSGAAQSCRCANGADPRGGAGGSSTAAPEAGMPLLTQNAGENQGSAACAPGGPGVNGGAGQSGSAATSAGQLLATGWGPAPSARAPDGPPGQGGGGGGKGSGASGGAGGCGGCGGAGGETGHPGGSSFCVVSFESKVTIRGGRLASGKGAAGGKGADGQDGQRGGGRGTASCAGGGGGGGSGGAAGGGGAGGHSSPVAYSGDGAPSVTSAAMTAGSPGEGGPIGAPGQGGLFESGGTNGAIGAPGVFGGTGKNDVPLHL